MIEFDKDYLLTMEPDFLQEAGMVARKATYVCPHCNNGKGVNKTGIERDGKNHYKCFSCGLYSDIIGLAMEEFDMEFYESIKYLCERYGIEYEEKDSNKKQTPKRYITSDNYSDYLSNAKANNNFEYLESRGISKRVQEKFNIGYDKHWRHPRAPKTVPETPRCIIPTSEYTYLARDIRPSEELNETEKKYCKSKVGTVHIFNEIELKEQTDRILFVVEGEIDAMSLEELYYPAIGLGSATNKQEFINRAIQERSYWERIYIIGDNDLPGQEAATWLKNELIRNKICDYSEVLKIPYKDPNEYLVKDREGFENFILSELHKGYRKNAVFINDEQLGNIEKLSKELECTIEDVVEIAIKSFYSKYI